MRIAVIGAGIVGVTTAFELARDGHEVTVFEKRGSVAAEASFANAGMVVPGYVAPWAAPGMPGTLLRSLFRRHGIARLDARLRGVPLRWLWQWRRACQAQTYRNARSSLLDLATLSRGRLDELTRALQLDYEHSRGCLLLLRGARDLSAVQQGLQMLGELGVKHSVLDGAACRRFEPGLSADTPLHAGIHLPDGQVANCRQFAHLLRSEAESLGVRFCFNAHVKRIVPGSRPEVVLQESFGEDNSAAARLDTSRVAFAPTQPLRPHAGTQTVDAVVVCAAMGSTELLAPLRVKLPMAPVYGYSVTAPIRASENYSGRSLNSCVIDERHSVAISRFGSRIRVAGGAELGGSLLEHDRTALSSLYKVLNNWFPGVAQLSQAQPWKGAQPTLPDGLPIVGPSGRDGVWLNLGHGTSGWALACSCACVITDLLAARQPAIDASSLSIERLRL